ncbi:MAG: discoidin domain-containing protein [Paludibacter sp.]|nr:discoidin domain-containing protein [Paludibacter sp.]
MKKSLTFFILVILVAINGMFAQSNLLSNWCAGTLTGTSSKPTDVGWLCTPNGELPWSSANTSPGCRFLDYNVSGGQSGFIYNGATLTSRIMYIRWDSGNSMGYFTYPVTLTACKNYTFDFKYSLAANATTSTISMAVCTSTDGTTGVIANQDFTCSTTLKTFLSGTLIFTPPTSGTYYLSFISNSASMNAIADLSLIENTSKALSTSVSTLTFDDINKVRTFTVNGNALTDSVKITAPQGISLQPTAVSAVEAQCGALITATFDGSRTISDESIVLNSGASITGLITVSSISGDGICFTSLYSDKTNLIIDPFINSLSNFTGWGGKSLDSISPYCGKYCGKISGTTGSIDYTLTLTPYTKYRMKAMVKTVGGSFQIGVSKYDGASGDINQLINTNGEWQALDFTFNSGQTVTGALTFFNNYQKDGTTGYIDNWELYEIGIVNGKDIIISTDQINEAELKSTLREMLVNHLPYSEGKYVAVSGYFGNGQSVEHGARTNADYAFVYSFIYKKCQDQTLPAGLSFEMVKQHALSAIRYSYKTHNTGTQNCTDGKKWGLVWESSMWCTSTAYAAWIMWDELTEADKDAVKAMVLAEANFKFSTVIPTGVNSDTKAEENGWDTNILAIAAAMFSEEKNAEAWTYRCKQYAMNTYSVAADLYRNNIENDVVDGKTIADWYIGANLFPDYALENHNFFHTSYLNIPIQEMSESLLAYKAIQSQTNPIFPVPDALKHNVSSVWNSMLKEFIMADGILAMPNGNDWSMYIYDELGTYSALACIYRDPDALMLESLVLQYAKLRQSTTGDGSFLLNPDVAERRMAVTARRLVFAHLYHDFFPTTDMVATKWRDFSKQHELTKYLPYSGIIRSNNDDKYVTFSWFQSADGTSYKSYMGMVSPNSADYSNIVFPFKTANTGNFTGYIDVSGYTRNASFVSNSFEMYPKSFSTTGKLSVTGGSMTKYLSFYSAPGKSTVYQEDMVANVSGTVSKDGGLMLGITTDVLTKISRNLYSQSGNIASKGDAVSTLTGNWVNVDNILGMVVDGGSGIAFGEKELSTSVYVSKLYGSYSTTPKSFTLGQLVYSRSAIVYPNVDATTTQALAAKAKYPAVATGWKATAAEDPDGRRFLLMSNFRSVSSTPVSLSYTQGAPVFDRITNVSESIGTATFNTIQNASSVNELYTYVKTGTSALQAVQGDSPYSVFVKNQNEANVTAEISIWDMGNYKILNTIIPAGECRYFDIQNDILTETAATFPNGYRNISRGKHVVADDQWPEHFPFAVIDDVDSTYYQSLILPTDISPENLTIRLGGLYTCNKLIVKSTQEIGPKDILIQTSNDGINFTTVSSTNLNNTTENQTVNFAESDAEYVRIKINSTFGSKNVGISAIQLFGYPK